MLCPLTKSRRRALARDTVTAAVYAAAGLPPELAPPVVVAVKGKGAADSAPCVRQKSSSFQRVCAGQMVTHIVLAFSPAAAELRTLLEADARAPRRSAARLGYS